MKTHRLILLTMVSALFLAACGPQKQVLNLYNWADYLDTSIIPEFEERFNCRVIVDTFESNEAMYAKIKAGAQGYDVIFPSSYQSFIMNKEGLLRPLNHQNIPNLKNIDQEFIELISMDPEMAYSVPYMVGTTGIAYLASKVPDAVETWALYNNPELAGRITLLDDMRETLGAALKFLGYSLNTIREVEVIEAGEIVREWRKNIAKFAVEDAKAGLASGEFWMVHQYNGDIFQIMDDSGNEDIVYMLPNEGFSSWVDDMVVPMSSDNPELAEAFINFMHEPEIAARNIEHNNNKCPNRPAYDLIDPSIRSNPKIFLSKEKLARSEQIRPLGEYNQIYINVWESLKTGR